MKNIKLIPIFLLIVISLCLSSASIEISEPNQIYNLGDEINTKLVITPPEKVEGVFEFSLICENDFVSLYKITSASSSFSKDKKVTLTLRNSLDENSLNKPLESLQGDCYLQVKLGNIISRTDTFKITKKIDIQAKLDKESYNPGETINLNIDSTKTNQKKLNGFIEISGIVESEKAISNGKLSENLVLPKNLEPDNYNLQIKAYEKDSNGKIINEGEVRVSFKINQIPTFIPITLSKLESNPGEKIEIGAEILDQSNKKIDGLINIEITSPFGEKNFLNINSGELSEFEFPTNALAGNWKIKANYGKLSEERKIKLNKKAILDISFIEDSSIVKIKNIGNTEFSDIVQLKISENPIEFNLNLKPNQEKKFIISAPNGEYDVRITGEKNLLEQRVLLTGNTISIREAKAKVTDYPIILITIILLIILLGIVLFFRFSKKEFNLNKKVKTRLNKIKNLKSDDSGRKILSEYKKNPLANAESSLVIKGIKEPTTIISLNIKNKLSINSKERLNGILSKLNRKEIAIEFKENEVILILSPRKTKNFRNEYRAVKIALDLEKQLIEHNRKFNEKINFGIGINSGDIIASLEKENLKYTGTDNTIPVSKKLSNLSNEDVLISERVKNKLLREAKTEKLEKDGITYYKVFNILEKQKNQEKLKDLLKRTHLD